MVSISTPAPRYTFGGAINDGEGLRIEERCGLGLATIMARKGVSPAEIGARLGIAPPAGPAWAGNHELTLVGTGPGVWLAIAENAAPDWAMQLTKRVAGVASISDQSGAYAVLRLSGAGARTLLSRGAYIDFHPASFRPGTAATTVIAHIGVVLWQCDDVPTYEIAIFRSYITSFRQWIASTALSV